MLMGAALRRRLRGQGGFTLVELLVAMSVGLVIVFAAFNLIDLATHVSSQTTDRVNSTTQARAAMEDLVQELNSGCVTSDISPIQAATSAGITPAVSTNATNLVFVTGLGQSGTLEQDGSVTPVEHVVSLNANGTLTDTSYAYSTGTYPTLQNAGSWTFKSTPIGKHVLLTHVAQQVSGGSTIPMFQYYSYANPSNTTAQSLIGAASITNFPLNTSWPITAANAAATIAEVDITWDVAPDDGSTDPSRATNVDDSVVFRLTPATPGGPNYPCD
jgi:prepilin-type N-terminal cleavage/methylation domain-containing protein